MDAYHAADLVLVPSHHGPFGLVVLEAWAAGRPVVATRTGGIPSFVEDGRDALLTEPQVPETLAGAAARLLTDHTLRAALVGAGTAKATVHHAWDAVLARHLDLYQDVCARRARRSA